MVELLESLSIDHQGHCQVVVIVVLFSWMHPIISFILDGTLVEEQKDAEKIRQKSAKFWLSKKKKLYRRSFEGPYLLYVNLEVVDRNCTKGCVEAIQGG